MPRFEVARTPIEGLMTVDRSVLEDARGFLSRLFCTEELSAAGFATPVSQINHTLTRRKGSVRGMHFQRHPDAEDKFVSCLRGEIMDVAVDLRPGSSTFLKWHAEVLSASNRRSLMIPKGFAHGFQTLCEDCELLYLHSAPYVAASEGALNAVDPALGIAWPLPITERSERDSRHPFLPDDFKGF